MDDDLVTLREAAEALGLNPSTVAGWADKKLLAVRGTGYAVRRLTTLADVRACHAARLQRTHQRAGGLKRAGRREPTEEELNAMIAEQMQCLPDWWADEAARERRGKAA